jgi:hypothetical protein
MKTKGLTYFKSDLGFSVNEGYFPNIHVRWKRPFGFYVAISKNIRFWFFV